MWAFKAGIGTFYIKPDIDRSGWYTLHLDDFHLGDFPSPGSAVAAVHERKTGLDQWDSLSGPSISEDLSQWDMVH